MALDRDEGTLLLLLDPSAAFDTVEHPILLNQLSQMGITGVAHTWLRDYISNRTQAISTGSCRSEEYHLTAGVLQGSVLGPIIFLCYVKPLADVIAQHMSTNHGYADDDQLYTHSSSIAVPVYTRPSSIYN